MRVAGGERSQCNETNNFMEKRYSQEGRKNGWGDVWKRTRGDSFGKIGFVLINGGEKEKSDQTAVGRNFGKKTTKNGGFGGGRKKMEVGT